MKYQLSISSGQTTANRVKTIQGQSDTKLSEVGIKQSEQLSQDLDCSRFDKIFSSDLSRALDTAKIVVKTEDRIQTDRRLRERGFGPIEGQSLDQLKALAAKHGFPPNKLSEFTPEGGESLEQVSQRVVDFFANHLIKLVSNGSRVLIVSHGGVIREMIKYFRDRLKCQFPKGSSPTVITPNTSLNEFKLIYGKKGLISAECLKLHDIQHLSKDMKDLALSEEQINDSNNSGQQEAL